MCVTFFFKLCQNLTRDFLNEGWLSKTGPKANDAYRKRWFTLDGRRLMYYEDPVVRLSISIIYSSV